MHDGKGADERLVAAHQALRDSGRIQFDLKTIEPPPAPPGWIEDLFRTLGRWLAPVGRFLRWVTSFMPEAPYARILLWGVIVVLAGLLLRVLYVGLRHGEWRLPWRKRRRDGASIGPSETPDTAWVPAAAPARQWLAEADRLAAAGDYAAAVHHLLLRSIDDIARRRPRLLRPALTSRELARTDAIPPAPRRLFADLAAVVERSLFGGRAIDAAEWSRCRDAYADFARARSWQG
ncbi:DUF4129 domain-containing protein [uncultured Sphingomonas sp.]|uniref:DUF4129 domain-containing protein n=1 Tax=uncultured Sphingomonas sp. TaxID=158754 RepID=UPI0025FC2CAE|nr:DUF4129 domain-containing protein [uncultured Sphingomonas sp.]